MDDAPERWTPAVGEPGYSISTHGRLWSSRSGRILKGTLTREGYTTHEFGGRITRRTRRLHCMVLEAFVGPRPDGTYGCHNDDDPANNRLSNLRWDTPASNVVDRQQHGRDHQLTKLRCPRRHLLVGGNLIPSDLKAGKRACRACNNAQTLAQKRIRRGQPAIDVAAYADRKYAEYVPTTEPLDAALSIGAA